MRDIIVLCHLIFVRISTQNIQRDFVPYDSILTLLPSFKPISLGIPYLGHISMLRRIKHVNRKLQKQRPFQDGRQRRIQLRWKGDQDARALGIGFVGVPLGATGFVASLGSGPLLKSETGDEEEEAGQEDGTHDAGVDGSFGACGSDGTICGERGGDHIDCYMD